MNDKLTSELFFRVHSFVKEKYMSLSAKQKKIVKLTLESIILSLADDKENYNNFLDKESKSSISVHQNLFEGFYFFSEIFPSGLL